LELLLSWKATRDDLGKLKLLTDDSRTMSCTPPWQKRNKKIPLVPRYIRGCGTKKIFFIGKERVLSKTKTTQMCGFIPMPYI
jgi:hypothetical protein